MCMRGCSSILLYGSPIINQIQPLSWGIFIGRELDICECMGRVVDIEGICNVTTADFPEAVQAKFAEVQSSQAKMTDCSERVKNVSKAVMFGHNAFMEDTSLKQALDAKTSDCVSYMLGILCQSALKPLPLLRQQLHEAWETSLITNTPEYKVGNSRSALCSSRF